LAGLETYALIGNTRSAALVSRDGSIDWLCLPRFDAESCFAALLDDEKGGCWRISSDYEVRSIERSYRKDSLVLETVFKTARGTVALLDCMPLEADDLEDPRQIRPLDAVLRVVRGITGTVRLSMQFTPRFDYGAVAPWVRTEGDVVVAAGGGDALELRGETALELDGSSARAQFDVSEGEDIAFLASYRPTHAELDHDASPSDWEELVERTDVFWRGHASRCAYDGNWRDEVVRSLLTLKALTYSPTGGIVAAATTSLPELIGGVRNWDYRYCWLRDATFVLESLLEHGYKAEAREWHDWLLRAIGGDPDDIQVMYGVTEERLLIENELDWLHGYEGSRPVRIGNDAARQFQLDQYGEVMDLFRVARRAGIDPERAWALQRELVEFVATHWREPDNGFWEIRAKPQHFVHSKVMAWLAVDRAVEAVEKDGKDGPADSWRQLRDEIREDVLTSGCSTERGCFVSFYGADEVDASLLRLPLVGFLPADDTRIRATIEAIENDLVHDGLVQRYRSGKIDDGLPPGEGTFFICTFWLAQCLLLLGRYQDAERVFTRAIELRNDVGLLSEQYSVSEKRLVGNFPQALSHVALATTAAALTKSLRDQGSQT
jgi:GH15 family glucan-1,4-alpha-glucosidase